MAELKTKLNNRDPKKFLESVEDPIRRSDSLQLLALFSEWTGEKPEMWGNAIVGFGRLNYTNSTGKTNEWMRLAFSPRKQNLSIYIMSGFGSLKDLLDKLGPNSIGKGCLYVKRLEDIDLKVLERIVKKSLKSIQEKGLLGDY